MADKYTKQCYVGIFDILGFKERVKNNTHKFIYDELSDLKSELEKRAIHYKTVNKDIENNGWKFDETSHILFSDTIVFITEDDQMDAYWSIKAESIFLIRKCIEMFIPIKGCIAKGEVSFNENKQILFGKPIIEAHLLSEEMKFMGVILDKSIEQDVVKYNPPDKKRSIPSVLYKSVPLKKGKVKHYILNLKSNEKFDYETKNDILLKGIKKMYESVNGEPRQYYDNTVELYWTKEEIEPYNL
jgi:hypothetical protein